MDEHDRIINWLTRRTADEMEVAAAEAITKLRAENEALHALLYDARDDVAEVLHIMRASYRDNYKKERIAHQEAFLAKINAALAAKGE